ncbi:MAG: hypothetical protein ROW39_07285 [Anaerolineaceae bacterium]|jgi:hypothetical protein
MEDEPDDFYEVEEIEEPSESETQRTNSEYNRIRINGISISLSDYPECFDSDDFDCEECDFCITDKYSTECRIADIETLEVTRIFFENYRNRYLAYPKHQEELIQAVRRELGGHGRPLHYSILTRIVGDRYPELRVSESKIIRIMTKHPRIFERVSEGVYRLIQ